MPLYRTGAGYVVCVSLVNAPDFLRKEAKTRSARLGSAQSAYDHMGLSRPGMNSSSMC